MPRSSSEGEAASLRYGWVVGPPIPPQDLDRCREFLVAEGIVRPGALPSAAEPASTPRSIDENPGLDGTRDG